MSVLLPAGFNSAPVDAVEVDGGGWNWPVYTYLLFPVGTVFKPIVMPFPFNWHVDVVVHTEQRDTVVPAENRTMVAR